MKNSVADKPIHNRHKEAVRRVLQISDRCRSRRRESRWTREDVHERDC